MENPMVNDAYSLTEHGIFHACDLRRSLKLIERNGKASISALLSGKAAVFCNHVS